MKPEHLHILQHSLGCDQYGKSEYRGRDEGDGCFNYHRNRYVCDPNPDMTELVALGLMQDNGTLSFTGTMHFYSVTEKGLSEMLRQSPAPPKISKSKARYRRYRSVADAFENFRHFLNFEKDERAAKRCGFSSVYDYYKWSRES